MKKFLTMTALALATLTASAQQATTPNRMIVRSAAGNKAYAVDKVDSITFATQEGQIKANVGFISYNPTSTPDADGASDTLHVSVTRTEACNGFNIAVLPTISAKSYTDDNVASYFERYGGSKLYEDFTNGQLTGIGVLRPGTSYTAVTMGYDQYDVAGEAGRAEFTTPKATLVGSPSVTYTIDEADATSFTLTVTPNADCGEFYWCQFGTGEGNDFKSQYELYAPMFGCANEGDFIKQMSWYGYSEATQNTWDGLKPNTNYEVYVQPADANGNYADMVVIPVTTAKLGGEGTAEVTISSGTITKSGTDILLPVVFTPNDQAGVHHDLCLAQEVYDQYFANDEEAAKAMQSDSNPFNPWDSYWNSVGTQSFSYYIDAEYQTYVLLSIAQNANGEYGPLAKKVVTNTMYSGNTTTTKSFAPAKRVGAKTQTGRKPGVVRAAKSAGLQLMQVK